MARGNGATSTGDIHERVAALEREHAAQRRLFFSEVRTLRADMKALAGTLRDTGRAVDTLLAELKLRDEQEDSAHG